MNEIYSKNKISQIKVRKLERDFKDNNIVNAETGEIIDIFYNRNIDSSYLDLTYKFSFFNRDMIDLYKELGPTNYGHLNLLINTMGYDNTVKYDKLDLGEAGVNKLKSIFKKKAITKYYKGKYYINPAISAYNRKVPMELINLFAKENQELYGITL